MLTPEFLFYLGMISVVLTVTFILATPLLIVILPKYFFINAISKPDNTHHKPTLVELIKKSLKNLTAVVVILAGIAMLFLPGQGLLSILVGIILLDTPWKRVLLKKIYLHRATTRLIGRANTLRHRFKKEPFVIPQQSDLEAAIK